jgi:hypothetical protein
LSEAIEIEMTVIPEKDEPSIKATNRGIVAELREEKEASDSICVYSKSISNEVYENDVQKGKPSEQRL